MPSFVIASVLGGLAGGITFSAAAGIGFAGFSMSAFFSSLVLGGLSKALAKKPSNPGNTISAVSAQRTLTYRSPIAPGQIVCGEAKVGGVVTFVEVSSDNQYWHIIITFSWQQCEAIKDFYFNDELVTRDVDGNVTGKYAGFARIQYHLGDPADVNQPFPDLVTESADFWTNAHLQRGRCKAYIRLVNNGDIFPSGVPNIAATVQGLVGITDPRDSTTKWTNNAELIIAHYLSNATYGVGSVFPGEFETNILVSDANICDERVALATDTTTFTADATLDAITLPAGVRRPQIGDGVRVSSDGALPTGLSAGTTYYVITASNETIKLASSAANALIGTAINITDAGTGTHTLTYYDEPRYRLNGAFKLSDQPKAIIEHMLNAMAGRAVNVGGQWHIFAGAYSAPTVTLCEGHFAGPISITSHLSRRHTCNGVKGLFTDPAHNWQPTEIPPLQSSTYLAEDSDNEAWHDIDVSGFVTSVTQGERLQKIDLLRTRQGQTVTGRFKLSAYQALTGRTLALTFAKFGLSSKAYEIDDLAFECTDDGRLELDITLRETAAAVYDWSTSDEQAQDIAPNTNLPDPATVGTPSVPSVTEVLYETTGSAGLKSKALVSWSAPDDALVVSYQLEYKLSTASDWIVQPLTKATSDEITDLEPELTYHFRVKGFNVFGVAGDYSPTCVKELRGLLDAPEDVANFSVQSYAGMAKFLWDPTTSIDVKQGGKVFVRWSPLTTGADWNKGSLVNPDGFPGADTSGLGPLYTGTYMAKFRDSTGHYSDTEASFVVTEALITGLSTLTSVTYHPTFAGSYSDVAVVDSALQLAPASTWDAMPGNVDDWGLVDYLGGIESSGYAVFTETLDLGSVKSVRLFTTIKSEGFDTGEVFDFRTNNVDDWGSWDGTVIDDAEASILVSTTDDNPSGSPSWGPWHALNLVGDYRCRAFRFQAAFTSANVTHNRRITELSIAAKQ